MKESFTNNAFANKYEYLKPDIKPIIGCIGENYQHFNEKSPEDIELAFKRLPTIESENIDWFDDSNNLDLKGMKNAGDKTYVISRINSNNKFSRGYADCTGIFVIGQDKNTNENISFATHQFPGAFLYLSKPEFVKDIFHSLDEIKDRSLEKTIDVVIVGGLSKNSNYKYDGIVHNLKEEYNFSIKLIDKIIFQKLGFHPNVIVGPKSTGHESVFYDTKNRRVYFGRSSMDSIPATIGFNAKDIDEYEKNNWEFPTKKDDK